jgi:DNA polymerase-3 subunit delta
MAQTITPAQLKTRLASGTVDLFYLLIGEEDLLRDRALLAVKDAILGEGGDDFSCDVFYGDEVDGSLIVACASEVVVFAPRRLVVVKAADRLPAKQAEPLMAYLKQPNQSTTMVFVAPKMDGRLKLTQALVQASLVVDCAPLPESLVAAWLKQESTAIGLTLTDESIHMLKEACGGSLYGARRELEKLASYVPAGRPVTTGDVEMLRGTEPGASVFDLAAAIGAQNRSQALGIVARNLEAGEAPLRILGSLAWQYRRLWKVKESLAQGGREGEAARALRMDPYKVRAFLEQFPESHLREALHAFLKADSQLKGGSQNKPAVIVDRLILLLCDRPKARGEGSLPQSPVPSRLGTTRGRTISNVRTIRSGSRSRNSHGA